MKTHALLLLCITLYAGIVNAVPGPACIITAQHHLSLAHQLKLRLASVSPAQIIRLDTFQGLAPEALGHCRIFVPVGRNATKSVFAKNTTTPIVSLLLRYAALQALLDSYPHAKKRTTALYLDQPFERQLNLAHELFQKSLKLGTIVKNSKVFNLQKFQKAAKARNDELIISEVPSSDEALIAANQLLTEIDVLLTFPDEEVFNRLSTPGILFAAYREKIPLIGYSKAWVQLGALAAVYTPPRLFIQDAVALIAQVKPHQALPKARFPTHFLIATNPIVAKNLNITLVSPHLLQARLEELEK